MTELAEKLSSVAEKIIAEKGGLDLFALFAPADAPDQWDLVVGADWAYRDEFAAVEYIAAKLKEALTVKEIRQISRIEVLRGSAVLSALLGTKENPHGVNSRGPFRYMDSYVTRALIIVLKAPRVRKVRRTLG
jgi:hypothetical protein